ISSHESSIRTAVISILCGCFHTNRNLPTLPFDVYRWMVPHSWRRQMFWDWCMNVAATVAAVVLLLAGSAAAQDGGRAIQKTSISLGTATPGGGFPLYGNAL